MPLSIKIKNVFFMILGSAIFSFGLVNFNIKNHLAEGGVTGITLILYNLFHIDPGISNLVLNIPLFFVGWRLLGKNVFVYTLISTAAVSLFLWVFEYWLTFNFSLKSDMTLAALFAGVFIGSGLGIIFRFGGTTGGTDIIARSLNRYFGLTIGKTMFAMDAFVIVLSLIYLDFRQAMYTLVAVFVAARVIDFIQTGAYAANALMIISLHTEEIADRIIKELDRSATLLSGKGGYSQTPLEVLYCVVSRSELFRLKQLIQSVDPHAFVTVHEIHDVMGEGFTLDENKKPLYDH
ncbi:YitT family protein [Pullulanibacillus sp. KACC 23026]|uniref:YitT family protein n=1 Tax=Pullulanibacillus sp. KACC 23026 TaxID=3028315 RepID=UPI0023B1092A|nr:YitT family protein [Pullulanibacillus sp. KACC 23026]WEG11343.1 YitT family protein [Pullulanibacillus sp. KACC 23026]